MAAAPFGHTAPVILQPDRTESERLGFSAFFNSLLFDHGLRLRLGGLHLTWHYLEEVPVARPAARLQEAIAVCSGKLTWGHERFAPQWEKFVQIPHENWPWRRSFALAPHERLRLRVVLEALVAQATGFDLHDLSGILADCDHPSAIVRTDEFTRTLDPKGFWRVDKEKEAELRLTVLAQVAFQDLQRLGLDAFLAQNNGEGWMLPEKLRLSDYGLGHDDRARQAQPVASRLGPRFHSWQLEGTVEESWEECRRHAALIRAIRSHGATASAVNEPSADYGASAPAQDLLGQPLETDLFGNEIAPSKNKRAT